MKKNSYSYDELINCGEGKLFGPGNAKLPLPPMLMFDRIIEINDKNGATCDAGRGLNDMKDGFASNFKQQIWCSPVPEKCKAVLERTLMHYHVCCVASLPCSRRVRRQPNPSTTPPTHPQLQT